MGNWTIVGSKATQPHLEDGTTYHPLRPTQLDKIENLHSLESINTENSDTHGRSVWVHSSRGGFLDNSVPNNSLAGEDEAVGNGRGAQPRHLALLRRPDLSWPSPDGRVGLVRMNCKTSVGES